MNEFIKMLIERLEEELKLADETKEKCARENPLMFDNAKGYATGIANAKYIVKQLAEERKDNIQTIDVSELLGEQVNDGWIPCEKELPPQPKGNVIFEGKPLELYLVSLKNADYPLRAFWNGKYFTDGWCKLDVVAWRELPAPYQQKGEEL